MSEPDASAVLFLMLISFAVGMVIGFLSGRLWQIDSDKNNKEETLDDD